MIVVFLLGLLLATLGVASYVIWPIEKVEVAGNQHLSPPQIIKLTGLEVGSPWLWAWDLRLDRLRQNPWVAAAQIERPTPGQIRLVIQERSAVAHLEDGRGIHSSFVGPWRLLLFVSLGILDFECVCRRRHHQARIHSQWSVGVCHQWT